MSLASPSARPVFVGNFVANLVGERTVDNVSDKVSDKGSVSEGGAKHNRSRRSQRPGTAVKHYIPGIFQITESSSWNGPSGLVFFS